MHVIWSILACCITKIRYLAMKHAYPAILAALFFVLFAYLAIEPLDRHDWLLENALVVAFAVFLGVTYKQQLFSNTSYTLIFLFLCLHEVGAHFTYAKVPYDVFLQENFGFSLNQMMDWERNHFDRSVHFLYGVLLVYPIYQIFQRWADLKGFWAYFFPVEFIMASSMLFELFEWGAAEFFGGDLGIAYLGTQGDVWDAHKDMALASLGAVFVMLWVYYRHKSKHENVS